MWKDLENTYDHIAFLTRILHRSDIGCVITAILMELGIPAKHEGYHYLKLAIRIYDHNMICMVSAKLYRLVAEEYGVTPFSVERAIRTVINAGWKNRYGKKWEYYFPGIDLEMEKPPTNHAFIAEIVRILEVWEGMRQTQEYQEQRKEISNGIE